MPEPTCGVCGRVLTPYAIEPPTYTLQEHPGRAGALQPVLNKRIRMDPETGAVCWCVDPPAPALTEGDNQHDRFSEITEVTEHHYDTGAYGRAHFEVPRPVFEAIRTNFAPPPPPDSYSPPPLLGNVDQITYTLMDIPIVIDDDLPAWSWRLVHNSTDEVLRHGTLDTPEGD